MNKRKKVQTIENTGKGLKAHIVCSLLLGLIGFSVTMYGARESNVELTLLGVVKGSLALLWYVVTKIRIWWNHG